MSSVASAVPVEEHADGEQRSTSLGSHTLSHTQQQQQPGISIGAALRRCMTPHRAEAIHQELERAMEAVKQSLSSMPPDLPESLDEGDIFEDGLQGAAEEKLRSLSNASAMSGDSVVVHSGESTWMGSDEGTAYYSDSTRLPDTPTYQGVRRIYTFGEEGDDSSEMSDLLQAGERDAEDTSGQTYVDAVESEGDERDGLGELPGRLSEYTSDRSSHASTESLASLLYTEEEEDTSCESAIDNYPVSDALKNWVLDPEQVKLVRFVGRGGFSTVYRAKYKNDETIAVKRFRIGEDVNDSLVKQFLREADLLRTLRHRNIVEFKGLIVTKRELCIAMEYVGGGSLRRRLDDTSAALEPSLIMSWALQIAKGMNYLHEEAPETIIHRDLKASNILVTTDNVLKLSDFGLAQQFDHTTVVAPGGTYAWMAPEVIRRNVFSTKSDVWAYGVVLWEMLTRQRPYAKMEPMAIAYGVASGRLTLPIPESCPAPFGQLMTKCWSLEPNERPDFRSVILTLQEPETGRRFSRTSSIAFKDLQNRWKEEIDNRLAQLQEQESEIIGRQEELERLQEEALRKERLLQQKEDQLEQLRQQLAYKEASLASSSSGKTRRSSLPFLKRKSRNRTQSSSQSPGEGGQAKSTRKTSLDVTSSTSMVRNASTSTIVSIESHEIEAVTSNMEHVSQIMQRKENTEYASQASVARARLQGGSVEGPRLVPIPSGEPIDISTAHEDVLSPTTEQDVIPYTTITRATTTTTSGSSKVTIAGPLDDSAVEIVPWGSGDDEAGAGPSPGSTGSGQQRKKKKRRARKSPDASISPNQKKGPVKQFFNQLRGRGHRRSHSDTTCASVELTLPADPFDHSAHGSSGMMRDTSGNSGRSGRLRVSPGARRQNTNETNKLERSSQVVASREEFLTVSRAARGASPGTHRRRVSNTSPLATDPQPRRQLPNFKLSQPSKSDGSPSKRETDVPLSSSSSPLNKAVGKERKDPPDGDQKRSDTDNPADAEALVWRDPRRASSAAPRPRPRGYSV